MEPVALFLSPLEKEGYVGNKHADETDEA